MSLHYKDYYKVLGIERNATADEIRKAFRKRARKVHPDVNHAPDAEERFKELNEAYEVLKDDEKRQRYDALGQNWQTGQEFRPPPGFENFEFQFGGQGFRGGFEGFSDFFETMFGGGGAGPPGARAPGPDPRRQLKGRDIDAGIIVTLEEVCRGATKKIELEARPRSGSRGDRRSIEVTIPKGVTRGSKIRLTGQGVPSAGGTAGDLFLTVKFAAHPKFQVDGYNITTDCRISPWEAALGTEVIVRTLDGDVTLTIPAGVQSGQKLRLRDRGLPTRGKDRGDLMVCVMIGVPKSLTATERELFEKLREESEFKPRD